MSVATEVAWFGENWARVIVALTSTGTLTLALKFYMAWTKNRSDEKKIDLDGDAKIREHWAAELAALRDQISKSGEAHAQRAAAAEDRYRNGLKAADERHEAAMKAADEREAACHAEVQGLREQVRELSDEIVGLRRQLGQAARSAIVIATHAPSDTIVEAADRAADALEKLDTKGTTNDR